MNPKLPIMNRSEDWLKQAQNDYLWGMDTLKAGHFAQCCFIAQQIAEKALKAAAYHRGYEIVKGHSVKAIVEALGINGPLATAAMRLDQYYIATRYPDAFPAGAPFEYFTREQAAEALEFAKLFLNHAECAINAT